MCEEYSPCHVRTGRLVLAEQSDSLFVPTSSLMTTPTLSTDDPAQEDLLQKYQERVERLQQQNRVIHTDLYWCTNGIVERAVRRVTEGTFAVLLQSGLDEKWWADSMECKTYLRNIQDLLSDWKTPNERRFGKPLKRTDHSV